MTFYLWNILSKKDKGMFAMNIWNLWKRRNASIWDHQNEEIVHRGDCTQFGTINLQNIFIKGIGSWQNDGMHVKLRSSRRHYNKLIVDRLSWQLTLNSFV